MSNTNQYTDLIAGAHRNKEKFTEWLYTLTEPLNQARQRLAEMQTDFDVDQAIGNQLDAIGARVGASRYLPLTLSNVYFALDDQGGIGLDLGVWKGEFDPDDGLVRLGDENYRSFIKSKILMNHWDGRNESIPDFVGGIFASFGLVGNFLDVQDFQTMRIALNISTSETPPVLYDLLTRRIIDIVAAGVRLDITENLPWFGLDLETASVRGLDDSFWFPELEAAKL